MALSMLMVCPLAASTSIQIAKSPYANQTVMKAPSPQANIKLVVVNGAMTEK